MRVALAQILLARPELLLLDEPTNYLDLESILWLEGFLRDYPGTVVMTCHDREIMNRVVGKIVEIDGGELRTLHRQLRLLRAGARASRRERREAAVRAPAGDAREGEARSSSGSRRTSPRRRRCRAGSRSSTRSRSVEPPRRIVEKQLRVPRAAALGRRRRQARRRCTKAYGARVVHDGLTLTRPPQASAGR